VCGPAGVTLLPHDHETERDEPEAGDHQNGGSGEAPTNRNRCPPRWLVLHAR